jgi:hypothetical protein
MDSSLDWCSRCCRFLFLLLAIFAFMVSYMALVSCEFLEYKILLPEFPPSREGDDDLVLESSMMPLQEPAVMPSPEPTMILSSNATDDDDDDDLEEGGDNPVPDVENVILSTATFGLFRYTLRDDPATCYGYEYEDANSIPTYMRVSR